MYHSWHTLCLCHPALCFPRSIISPPTFWINIPRRILGESQPSKGHQISTLSKCNVNSSLEKSCLIILMHIFNPAKNKTDVDKTNCNTDYKSNKSSFFAGIYSNSMSYISYSLFKANQPFGITKDLISTIILISWAGSWVCQRSGCVCVLMDSPKQPYECDFLFLERVGVRMACSDKTSHLFFTLSST